MRLYKLSIMSLILLMFGACQLNDMMSYSDPTAVYFTSYSDDADSVTVSFTITTDNTYTTTIDVSLLGNPIEESGVLPVRIVEEETDAIAGVHYTPLEDITIEVGDLSSSIPLELLYTDDMDSNTYTITLELYESSDFLVGYPDKAKVRVKVTNQVIKPSYWDSLLVYYFGTYSTQKHEDAIELMGHDFPIYESDITDYSYYMLKGRALCLYYALNVVYDENGDRIETWNVF